MPALVMLGRTIASSPASVEKVMLIPDDIDYMTFMWYKVIQANMN